MWLLSCIFYGETEATKKSCWGWVREYELERFIIWNWGFKKKSVLCILLPLPLFNRRIACFDPGFRSRFLIWKRSIYFSFDATCSPLSSRPLVWLFKRDCSVPPTDSNPSEEGGRWPDTLRKRWHQTGQELVTTLSNRIEGFITPSSTSIKSLCCHGNSCLYF